MGEESRAQFAFVVGPTASGKSDLALRLAQQLTWPIINCDSLQVYKEINIGTAKPSVKEMQSVPHYLFDYIEPPATITAAQYLQDVSQVLKEQEITQAIFVGGSGFYLQALIKGLYPQGEIDPKIKDKVEEWIAKDGYEAVFKWLQGKDPQYCEKISPQDHYRIRRSAEIILNSGKSISENKKLMSEQDHSVLPPHQRIIIGLNDERRHLRKRVEKRTETMLAQGFVEEVENLVDKGMSHWPPLSSVGYREVQAHLAGQISHESLYEQIVTSTMQLIKKQQTWFKRNPEIQWFTPDQSDLAFDTVQQWATKPLESS